MTADLIWEDPPERFQRDSVVKTIARQLREHPGKWARVIGPTDKAKVESVRIVLLQGRSNGINQGEFECKRRTLEDGCYLWARFKEHE